MKYTFFFFSILYLFLMPLKGQAQDDFDVIMKNIFHNIQHENNTNINLHAGKLLATIQPNGSWPDIHYQSHSQTGWVPGDQLKRIADLCKVYSREGSKYYGNTQVRSKIIKAMQYWLHLNPAPYSTNWYYRSISVPQDIGRALICLRLSPKGVSDTLENAMLSWMKKGIPITRSPSKNGSNLIDVALHYIMRACLTKNTDLLQQAIRAVTHSIEITSGEGIQSDFSFHAHGPQLYIYGYGSVYLSGIMHIADYIKGTRFAFSSKKMALLSNFVRNGFLPVSRGRYADFNVFGRGVSRPGATKADAPVIEQMKSIDAPKYNLFYTEAIQRMTGTKPPSYHIQSRHFYFWRSDYTVDQKPDYTFGLRCVSTRTAKSENGNRENLKGYYMTDGVTDIAVNGNEYYNIFPVWDWNKIPGTTAPAITTFPLRSSWGSNMGKASFVGGVSDGTYGASVYNMNDYQTTAKKSWFFFDHEIVCLGSGISSTARQAINTTVNQCLLDGKVEINDGYDIKTLPEGIHPLDKNIRWVLHDSVGYFFPEKCKLTLSNQAQTGSWKSVNNSYPATTITKEVFKLWIQHGVQPHHDQYAYMVVPGIPSVAGMERYNSSEIKILSNTTKIQAVEDKTLHNLQIVFYAAGTFRTKGIKIKVDKPCIMMLENIDNSNVSVYAADPSQTATSLHIGVKTAALNKIKQFDLILPRGQWAGSTVHGK